MDLTVQLRRTYAEVSIMELSAFVAWRHAQITNLQNESALSHLQAGWDGLECDDKVDWLPEDPRASLSGDPTWAALLRDWPAARANS